MKIKVAFSTALIAAFAVVFTVQVKAAIPGATAKPLTYPITTSSHPTPTPTSPITSSVYPTPRLSLK